MSRSRLLYARGPAPQYTTSRQASDQPGSLVAALDTSGTVTAQQLYGPYGTGRYSLGSMPTSKGYTGQYGDPATTGLDYYGARYYDPLVGQFTQADTDAKGGLNRYAYVADDPETATDPTGHRIYCGDNSCGSSGGGGCTSNCGSTPPCIASCKSPCWPHCSSGGSKPPTQRQKGWNGCYSNDRVCQGAKAQAEANSIYKQLTDELRDKLGDVFQYWLAKFNPFLILRDQGLDKFLTWLGGDGAKMLWALVSRDGRPEFGFVTTLMAWGLSLGETQHDAAWFQDPNNIAAFGRMEEQQDDIYLYQATGLLIGGILGVEDGGEAAVSAALGIGDGLDAFDKLDESVLYQLFQFDPFPPTFGGSEHLLM